MIKALGLILCSVLCIACINITFASQSNILTFLVSGLVGILFGIVYRKFGERRLAFLACLLVPVIAWFVLIVELNSFLLFELVPLISFAGALGFATTALLARTAHQKKKWMIGFLFVLVFLGLAFYAVPAYSTYLYSKQVDEPKPLVLKGLRDLNGNSISLESYRGKVILLDVWGIHCGACRHQKVAIEQIQETLKDTSRFVIFAVNSGEDTREEIREYLITHPSSVPVLYDDGTLMKRFKFDGIPNTILLNTSGCVSWYKSGFSIDDRLSYANFLVKKMKRLAQADGSKKPVTFAFNEASLNHLHPFSLHPFGSCTSPFRFGDAF